MANCECKAVDMKWQRRTKRLGCSFNLFRSQLFCKSFLDFIVLCCSLLCLPYESDDLPILSFDLRIARL